VEGCCNSLCVAKFSLTAAGAQHSALPSCKPWRPPSHNHTALLTPQPKETNTMTQQITPTPPISELCIPTNRNPDYTPAMQDYNRVRLLKRTARSIGFRLILPKDYQSEDVEIAASTLSKLIMEA